MTNGDSLTVENCLIVNLPSAGIYVGNAANVRVADTTLRDNATFGLRFRSGSSATVVRTSIVGSGDTGIWVDAAGAGTLTTADIADSTIDGSGFGITVASGNATAEIKTSVHGSRITRNGAGVVSQSTVGAASGVVTVMASDNVVSNNDYGLVANFSGARMWASGNAVSNNGAGLRNNGGLFESAGNNAVRNNTADTQGTITSIAMK